MYKCFHLASWQPARWAALRPRSAPRRFAVFGLPGSVSSKAPCQACSSRSCVGCRSCQLCYVGCSCRQERLRAPAVLHFCPLALTHVANSEAAGIRSIWVALNMLRQGRLHRLSSDLSMNEVLRVHLMLEAFDLPPALVKGLRLVFAGAQRYTLRISGFCLQNYTNLPNPQSKLHASECHDEMQDPSGARTTSACIA